MESLDLIQIISGNSPAMAFGIICLVWMRSDRAAALEDAKAYAASLKAYAEEQRADKLELLRAYREVAEKYVMLERRVHEISNYLQGKELGEGKDRLTRRGREE